MLPNTSVQYHDGEALLLLCLWHLDWETDAAFLVAFLLFPERFTKEELQAATDMLLIHVPAHVVAAARLAGKR